jgi:hypothetical protein
MQKTFFLLGDLTSKDKKNIDFFKKNIQKAFNEIEGKVNLILSPKDRINFIHPIIVGDLKRAEKRGKFKVKRFIKDKRKKEKLINKRLNEKIINKIFNFSGYLPNDYSLYDSENIIYMNKHRIKIHIAPLTQEMLYLDWRSKLLLQNSNLIYDEKLLKNYMELRKEKINVYNNAFLSFINSVQGNKVVFIDLFNNEIIKDHEGEKKIFSNSDNLIFEDLIYQEVLSRNQKLYK